jgi:serine/threonine-protein kinase
VAGRVVDEDSDPAVADTSAPERLPAPAEADAGVHGGRRDKGPRQIRSGDRLGRYEIGDELGEGGMATVFRARDRELRRDVAVKVLFPHLARRAEIVRRFHREARAAAGLEHPNILRIYDVGGAEGDDPPYIVMELIRGRTLLQEIEQRGAMLAEIAACIGALLGDALAAAHAAGVIHRDIKPANVLIAPGGRLLLADFGVARLETEDSLVTRTGAVLGTPAYMSPEQASGDTATSSSDVYSLGATLYQLATGALPYAGTPAKVLSQIAAGSLVAPVRRKPSCGPELSRLIEKLMASEPAARPAGAALIAAELRALAAAGGFGDATEELSAYFEDPAGFLRARTPMVVTSVVAAARTCVVHERLPRAMALAERASALAPDDPAVVALVHAVTQSGHTSRRRRAIAIVGLALGLAGATSAVAWQLMRTASSDVSLGASLDATPGASPGLSPDASPGLSPVASVDSLRDAAIGSAPITDDSAPPDAGPTPTLDERAADDRLMAALPPRDAGATLPDARTSARAVRPAIPADAAVRRGRDPRLPPSDVAPSVEPVAAPPVLVGVVTDAGVVGVVTDAGVVDAPTAVSHVIIKNDLWCTIWIDGVERGNRRGERLEVSPGDHTVRCVNPAGEWTQQVYVAPGATRTLTGTPIRELQIRVAVDATIDGKRYPSGSVARLKPSNVEVTAGNKRGFITFRVNCTLRDMPELACYP